MHIALISNYYYNWSIECDKMFEKIIISISTWNAMIKNDEGITKRKLLWFSSGANLYFFNVI